MENPIQLPEQPKKRSVVADMLISSLIGVILVPIITKAIRGIIGWRNPNETFMAIASPKNRIYFFPLFQAIRIVRKQSGWTPTAIVKVNRIKAMKLIWLNKPLYTIHSVIED